MARHSLPSLFDRDRMPSLLGRDGDPFTALRRQMDEVFDAFTGGTSLAPILGKADTTFAPKIDISETDKELKVCADLPGLEEKDVEVKLAGNQLVIRGEKKSEHEDKDDDQGKERTFHRVERSYGMFQRAILLPFDVDAEKVEASFKNGVLTVTLPKPEQVQQQARRIEVKKAQ